MNLLGIDTSTEACTVGLQLGTDRHESLVLERQHAERILEEIDQLLRAHDASLHDMDAMVWGRGPGMFTGLRIGAGVVQGIAYAIERPVVCVSSLAVIAAGQDEPRVLAAIDARINQVYWAAYEKTGNGLQALCEEQVSDPGVVGAGLDGQFVGAGSGWDQYTGELMEANAGRIDRWNRQQYPRAGALLSLGEAEYLAGKAVTAMEAVPVYVRDKVAKKTSER